MLLIFGAVLIAAPFLTGLSLSNSIPAIVSGVIMIVLGWEMRGGDEATSLKSPKITRIKEINTGDELSAAIADVKNPGFGNVGRHVTYRTTDEFKEFLNGASYDDVLDAAWLLDNPDPRIETNYTRGDTGIGYTVRHEPHEGEL